jgi:hypothetical protein
MTQNVRRLKGRDGEMERVLVLIAKYNHNRNARCLTRKEWEMPNDIVFDGIPGAGKSGSIDR